MTDDVIHVLSTTQYYIKYVIIQSYLSQFAAQTIETWLADGSTLKQYT